MSDIIKTKIKQELRFLITNNCNYSCIFCHLEGMSTDYIPIKKQLTAEDYVFMFEEFRKQTGCDTVTLTGGEPFIRKDILEILTALHSSGAKITVVTNGSLLPKDPAVYQFIERLNISLHTLEPEKYKNLTGIGNLDNVLNNILFVKTNFPSVDVRLNAVISSSDEDIIKLIEWSEKNEVSIKFIELYPNTCDGYRPVGDIEDLILNTRPYAKLSNDIKRQRSFEIDGRKIVLTQITCAKAMEQNEITPEEYCQKNQDIFITPDGQIKLCMNTFEAIPVMEAVKARDGNTFTNLVRHSITRFGEGCREDKKL